MRILALDIGKKRIGVAISDALGIIAQGVKVIQHEDESQAIKEICGLAKEREVGEIVAGLPLSMDGSKSAMTNEVLRFVESLKQKTDIPITTWDERLSSAQVERDLIFMDVSRSKRKKINDMLAAQVILQNYLDSKKVNYGNESECGDDR